MAERGAMRSDSPSDDRTRGCRASSPNRSVQRSHSTVVTRVRVRAACDQTLDDRMLCTGIPVRSTRNPVSGIVERLGAASVPRSDACAGLDEQLRRRSFVRGPRCVGRCRCEFVGRVEHPTDDERITRCDRTKEPEQGHIVRPFRRVAGLRHRGSRLRSRRPECVRVSRRARGAHITWQACKEGGVGAAPDRR
jgi:hypothetical protein